MQITDPAPRAPRRRARVVPCRALVALLLAALAGGCAEPAPPGGHGHLERRDGAPALLRLEGSPHEMGWWHGRLLKDRLLALHERWRRALERDVLGAGRETPARVAMRRAIDQHGDLCLDQTLMRLSERQLQELEGMAKATGLEPEQLLRLDVLRDALRMKGLAARLSGAAGVARTPQGYEARGWWSGEDSELLTGEALVIHRKPTDRAENVVVSWPGSLGALAALTSAGLGYIAADAEVRDKRRIGFGGGRPFYVAAREALAESDSVGRLMASVTGTMGHVFVGFSLDASTGGSPLRAMATFEVYGAGEPPMVLDSADLLGIGPYENDEQGQATALEQAVRSDTAGIEERWLQLSAHAAPGNGPAKGLRVTITWAGAEGRLSFAHHEGGDETTVRLP